MPLYEYQCESCRKLTERIQKYSDPPLEACPACGGAVRKLVSSPAIQFKGSGWYITDYARKGGTGEKSDGAGKTGTAAEKTDTSGKSEKSGSSGESSAATPAKSDG
jgi:putative FmdB family regulatory protein